MTGCRRETGDTAIGYTNCVVVCGTGMARGQIYPLAGTIALHSTAAVAAVVARAID